MFCSIETETLYSLHVPSIYTLVCSWDTSSDSLFSNFHLSINIGRLHPTYLYFPMSEIWPPVYWPPLLLRSLTLLRT